MKFSFLKVALTATLATLLPLFSDAQGLTEDLHSLRSVLQTLYDQMIPMCTGLINIGRGIAGFAALWFIAARVWKHIAASEPIDFYPLLRPFAVGFCILSFPAVIALINGILQPTVNATNNMVNNTNEAVRKVLDNEASADEELSMAYQNQNSDKYYQYAHPDQAGNNAEVIADRFSGWGFKNMIKKAISEFLNLLFEAAALCLDTIRTFKLIVLAILGPLCFGLSVFDGFQHTLKQWISRYVNVYMWLPVANIFGAIIGKIQLNMLAAQQEGLPAGEHFSNTNTAYMIFLIIGIVGYFTVPGIANYIMNVGGHALFNRTSALASMAISYAGSTVMQSIGNSAANNMGASSGPTSNTNPVNNHMKDKVSGESSTKS